MGECEEEIINRNGIKIADFRWKSDFKITKLNSLMKEEVRNGDEQEQRQAINKKELEKDIQKIKIERSSGKDNIRIERYRNWKENEDPHDINDGSKNLTMRKQDEAKMNTLKWDI